MGPAIPNGCSKSMEWHVGVSHFDKDQITGRLTLYNNIFSDSANVIGNQQNVKCDKYEQGQITWSTDFNFVSTNPTSDGQVKSYSNAAWAGGKSIQISALKIFYSNWYWTLTNPSHDLVADVSYDIFTSKDPNCPGQAGGCASHEIMIWLVSKGNAKPAGEKVQGDIITIGKDYTFDVWKGVVGGIPVISLTPTGGKAYQAFSGNLLPLFRTGLTGLGLDSSEYVCTVGTGVEPFKGSARLDSQYGLLLF
ncbi:hypothetical protein CROQUDRAFT_722458 [Cronartium quercuum f. sp. fusiforme G11]|uniref:Uncharacterized protein n=1 Tax=Cronartium quercuum f. sp. fusiforme G11 TaxID=708437 RepID=A0A9P6NJK6_9BASI|nr:hypothetical protein CROQUDRAFT_722458 [Cronartium quercuum f. sp. fusiforme G11]